ncbi:Hypothetical predicted protein [Octopus vulgaris]|uniref:Uncharacterized protein n=1 Tax=Octopus vulgaris TaxID=6645 RepID=A0AA36B8Y2_OCTVU|nr:Hypothetical predicted protein [Octopus vulgaris]
MGVLLKSYHSVMLLFKEVDLGDKTRVSSNNNYEKVEGVKERGIEGGGGEEEEEQQEQEQEEQEEEEQQEQKHQQQQHHQQQH